MERNEIQPPIGPCLSLKKLDPSYFQTHPTPAIPLPEDTAALCLWREMDKLSLERAYANCRKKLLRIRHKMGWPKGMINMAASKEKPGAGPGFVFGRY
ncbi:hypothetical protein SB748_20195 [Rhizobium sp. SIMBA_035]